MSQVQKKVLYIVTKSVWGGAQKYVYDLATHLPRVRFSPIVAAGGFGVLADKLATIRSAAANSWQAEIPYRRVTHLDRDVRLLGDIGALIELARLIIKTRPDIIHV